MSDEIPECYGWDEIEFFPADGGYIKCPKCGHGEAFIDDDDDNYGNLYCNSCGCATIMVTGFHETDYPLGHNQPYYQNKKKEVSA